MLKCERNTLASDCLQASPSTWLKRWAAAAASLVPWLRARLRCSAPAKPRVEPRRKRYPPIPGEESCVLRTVQLMVLVMINSTWELVLLRFDLWKDRWKREASLYRRYMLSLDCNMDILHLCTFMIYDGVLAGHCIEANPILESPSISSSLCKSRFCQVSTWAQSESEIMSHGSFRFFFCVFLGISPVTPNSGTPFS